VSNRLIGIGVAAAVLVGGVAAFIYFSGEAPAPPPTPSPRAEASKSPEPTPAVDALPKPTPKPAAKPADPSPTPTAAPTTGTLIIESDVPGTSVFVDREYLGTAPITAKDLRPGPHRINMSADGYEGVIETIDIEAGSTRTFSYKFKEIRLDQSIAVSHKHGIGSCSGTLRATPKGLTYDTTNKGDAFSVALTELETFSIDYLEKNLRVKIKNGKTLNFADAGGDVNKLYAFHKEVEKARQRLISGK
jgi:hypothetical protein